MIISFGSQFKTIMIAKKKRMQKKMKWTK